MQSETRNCQNCKNDFVIDSEDFNFYKKINVPTPTFCPACRRQRRNAWRNNFSLYSRKCELCDKKVVSIYSPESKITVFCNKCWWSDKWDSKRYAMDYDSSRPFFEQFKELLYKVPHMAIVNDDGIASLNCEYTHDIWFSKNCYMCFSGWRSENSMYSFFSMYGKNVMDLYINMAETEYVYDSINCSHGFKLKYSFFSRACIESQFLFDCQNCSNCFLCSGLRNKQYCFRNKQYSKEEYGKILESYRLDTFSGVEKAKEEYEKFTLKQPRRYLWLKQNTNSIGDIVSYSKNTRNSFVVKEMENCRYVEYSTTDKESYDLVLSGELSECYEGIVADHSQLNFFGIFSVKNQDVQYTQHCHSSRHLFGCVGLRNAKYSILNKEYSKEEYRYLVKKIIKEMNNNPYIDKLGNIYKYGEFFPTEMSPFGYNESFAIDDFPLKKEKVILKGYRWQDNVQKTQGKETLLGTDLPDSIFDIKDEILNEVLKCISCERNYKILEDELTFYKKMEIPIPRKCFQCRHKERLHKINFFKLWHRKCMCGTVGSLQVTGNHQHEGECTEEFETSYAPDRPEIIYCEKCYQAEMY